MHVNVFSCYKNMNLFHCGDIHEYLRCPFECSMLSQGTPIFTIFLKEYNDLNYISFMFLEKALDAFFT